MLTRDEVVQLILYLVVATVLLLASRERVETIKFRVGNNLWIRDVRIVKA